MELSFSLNSEKKNYIMDNNKQNKSYHRPIWDEHGRIHYELIPHPIKEDHISVCLVPPEKVIPVIFIPGVMGSNLKNTGGEVWQFSAVSLVKWPLASPEKRKLLLDPKTTTVDDAGEIFNDAADGKKFPSRRERGWGSAFYMSYGEALDRLQYLLNDDDILMDNYFREEKRQTARQKFIGVRIGDEDPLHALTNAEVAHSHRFLFPLHVFGYNWLQSNATSAERLGKYITTCVLPMYRQRLAVDKVILITHSMGGLVARHYSENLDGQKNILGIVHGVMPDLGSPSTYRRMKTGERGKIGMIIGDSAEKLMPVLAQSPGPLQLLPGKAYGPGWLKIQRSSETVALPVSDPYEEIYLNKADWWRLYEAGISGGEVDDEWNEYETILTEDAQKFIEKLNGKYHPHTWLFYGASQRNPSDEALIWKERPAPVTLMKYPELQAPTYRQSSGCTFELLSSGSPGDGTVPVKSIRLSSPQLRGVLATDVVHEGAYTIAPVDRTQSVYSDLSDALLFTVRAVVKIVQQVPVV